MVTGPSRSLLALTLACLLTSFGPAGTPGRIGRTGRTGTLARWVRRRSRERQAVRTCLLTQKLHSDAGMRLPQASSPSTRKIPARATIDEIMQSFQEAIQSGNFSHVNPVINSLK